jgi:ABC-type methionine transport system ATPase subunit
MKKSQLPRIGDINIQKTNHTQIAKKTKIHMIQHFMLISTKTFEQKVYYPI